MVRSCDIMCFHSLLSIYNTVCACCCFLNSPLYSYVFKYHCIPFFTSIIIAADYAKIPILDLLLVFELPIAFLYSLLSYSVGNWLHQVTMALAFNNNNTIYYYIDAQQSIWLTKTYFASPDYLLVQDWIHATLLTPDAINLMEPPVYHYATFFRV